MENFAHQDSLLIESTDYIRPVQVWLVGVVVRRYIDILTININFPYSTYITSFWGSSIPTSLFIFKMFFSVLVYNTLLWYITLSIIVYYTEYYGILH